MGQEGPGDDHEQQGQPGQRGALRPARLGQHRQPQQQRRDQRDGRHVMQPLVDIAHHQQADAGGQDQQHGQGQEDVDEHAPDHSHRSRNADEHQAAAEHQHGQQHRQLELAGPPEALGQQHQHHDHDRAERLVGHHRVHERAAAGQHPARDHPGQHGDGRDHEDVHRAGSPSVTTSWCTIITSRSGIDAEHERVRGDRPAANQQHPPGLALGRVRPVPDGQLAESARGLLPAGQPPPQGREDDHGVPRRVHGQPEGRGHPFDPGPEPGPRLMSGQLGQERPERRRPGPGQQLIQGDGVVQDDPERHQQDPPHQPRPGPARDHGPPACPAVALSARGLPAPFVGHRRQLPARPSRKPAPPGQGDLGW